VKSRDSTSGLRPSVIEDVEFGFMIKIRFCDGAAGVSPIFEEVELMLVLGNLVENFLATGM
jgi:hypothetical protein